jgi:hypothetical protein
MRDHRMIRILAAVSALLLVAATPVPPKVRPICGIPFESPQQVEKLVKKLPKVVVLKDNGFVRGYTNPQRTVVFIFTSPKSAAYPAVVCRFPAMQDKQMKIFTDLRCGAKKAACDKLAAEYRDLDRQISEQAKKQVKPQKKP